MSEQRYDIRVAESCVDPNPLMVERQDPDNFTLFQTRKRCALEIAAYVFKIYLFVWFDYLRPINNLSINKDGSSWVEPVLS